MQQWSKICVETSLIMSVTLISTASYINLKYNINYIKVTIKIKVNIISGGSQRFFFYSSNPSMVAVWAVSRAWFDRFGSWYNHTSANMRASMSI